jgi:hypothetical protein
MQKNRNMKAIYKIGVLTVAIGIVCCTVAGAQEFKTDESIRTQLKKGGVQGLQYGTEKKSSETTEADKPKTYTRGNFKSTLDDGKSQPGVAAGRKSAQRNLNSVARGAQNPLPSDQAAVKKEQPKIEPPKPPAQGEEKKAN